MVIPGVSVSMAPSTSLHPSDPLNLDPLSRKRQRERERGDQAQWPTGPFLVNDNQEITVGKPKLSEAFKVISTDLSLRLPARPVGDTETTAAGTQGQS